MEASRAGADSSLNGLSGLCGSAAKRNSPTANDFSDCIVSTRADRTVRRWPSKVVSRSRPGREASLWKACDSS